MPIGFDDDFLDIFSSPVVPECYCPLCNKELRIRQTKDKRHQFMGCDYPACLFSCDVYNAGVYALTVSEHSVVDLGGVNSAITGKRQIAQQRVNLKRERMTNGAPLANKVFGPSMRPSSVNKESLELEALKYRVKTLEDTVQQLQEYIKADQERRAKMGFDLNLD